MINEETIVSVYDDKMTLLQFLKTINKALDEAVLTSVEVSKKGNATLSFVFDFADGTKIESGEIVLQQGESVTDAKIVDGHLYLTLSNDERLDAGNVKPVTRFEINASQHLIVYYGDGTSQDLGAILQGNVNIDGNLTANSIIENMNGYKLKSTKINDDDKRYISIVKTGNKITFVLTGTIAINDNANIELGSFEIPSSIGNRLFPNIDVDRILLNDVIATAGRVEQRYTFALYMTKWNNTSITFYASKLNHPPVAYINGNYIIRAEITFLLSNNMEVANNA